MTIEELKQALEAATPGPWRDEAKIAQLDMGGRHLTTHHVHLPGWRYAIRLGEDRGGEHNCEANARLIAAAVNNLPKLLKVAERAQTMLDAIDKGAVYSDEIVSVPGDGPPYPFHVEWAYHTRKALEELGK